MGKLSDYNPATYVNPSLDKIPGIQGGKNVNFNPSQFINSQLYGKKIVLHGDSITEGGEWATIFAALTGATVYNAGIGGTQIGRNTINTEYSALSLASLSEAILSGDWNNCITAAAAVSKTARLNEIMAIDYTTVNYIVVLLGTNDFGNNRAIGTNTDTGAATTTFKGGINFSISNLLQKNPKLEIIFFSPFYRSRYVAGDGHDSDNYGNTGGTFLIEYVNALIEVANLNHIKVVDFYRNLPVNAFTAATYLSDGLHPSSDGYTMIGRKIAKELIKF